jgi:tyrosinase
MATTTPSGAVKLLVALFLLYLLLTSSSATSYHRRVHARTQAKTLSRRQNTTDSIVPVLGLPGLGVTTVYPRLEIRELQRRPDQFNVYLLGLRRFQNTSQDDKLSYFQIAGMYSLGQAKHEGGADCPQASMADLLFRGTAYRDERIPKKATVRTAATCFQLGTGRILL